MKKTSEYIAGLLSDNCIIQEKDRELCRYGLEVLLSSVLEILSVIIISAFTGNFVETLFFFFTFIPLRIYAGGYHADTRMRCYGILLAVYFIFSMAIKIIPVNAYTVLIGSGIVFSFIMVALFSPVVYDKKSVNDTEKHHYRTVSLAIIFIQILVILIGSLVLKNNSCILSMSIGQLSVSLSMAAAIIKKNIKNNERRGKCYEKD